jgi:hypothetical protein
MVRSAPQISFSVTSINYGTIDVGDSATNQTYHIYMPQNSTTMTEALNMSISFKSGVNAGEAMAEEWVRISTVDVSTHIGSIGTGTEAWIGSVQAGTGRATSMVSVYVQTNIVVPSGADTAGAVTFYLHHRYQYTGDDDDYAG